MNGNNNKTNQKIIGTFASILFAALIGSGCSSMHNITSSYQINESPIEAAPLAKTTINQSAIDSNVAASIETSQEDSSSELEATDDFETETSEGNGLYQAMNSIAEDIINKIAEQTAEPATNAPKATTSISNAKYVPSGIRYFKSANSNQAASQLTLDVNGDCQFSGADITRLVANANGQVSLNHCSLTMHN
jgi:hypothetical protein